MGLDTSEWQEANGETNGSTSTAPLAISRSTFSRQHPHKDLSNFQREIHLMEIKYCEDTIQQDQLSATQEQHKGLCSVLQEPPLLPSTPSFWEWVAPSTTITRWSLLRSWVLILKEVRNLLPSFMFILSITLPNLSIPDMPFPALLSTLIRRRLQVKPVTLLILNFFSFWWRSFTVLSTKVAPFP